MPRVVKGTIVAPNVASAPGSPQTGQLYYDTVAGRLYVRGASAWIDASISQGGTTTGSISFSGTARATNLLDPASAQDAATKNYVDSNPNLVTDWKQSVRVVANSNGALATAFANGQVVDGITLATGDRILLAAQATTSENGIYTVNVSGAPTRAVDAASSTQLTTGSRVWVESGTVTGFSIWTYVSGAFTAQVWTNAYYLGPSNTNVSGGSGTLNLVAGTNTAIVTGSGFSPNGRTPVAAIDLASSTATPGGIAFGANEFQLYRSATNTLKLNATSGLDMSSAKIINVLDPTSAQDAATKNYVDTSTITTALDWKASVRVVSVFNAALATAYANGQTVDGVTLATGDRILLTNQLTTSENGIYTVNASGAPTRTADASSSAQLTVGATVYVEQGGLFNTTWKYNSGAFTAQQWSTNTYFGSGGVSFGAPANSAISGNSTTLFIFTNSANAGTFTTTGLGLGNRNSPAAILDLPTSTATAGGIAFGANEFQLYRSAAQTLKLNATSGLDMSSAKIANVLDPAAAQDAATKNYVDTKFAKYYSALGSGTGTTITITQATHQLRASRGIIAQTQEESTGNLVDTDTSVASNGDVTITFASSQTLTGFRVTLVG